MRAVVAHPGEAVGDVVFTDEPLSFWRGLDPGTGRVSDGHHELFGRSLQGKVLVLPAGRGSSSSSGVLLEAIRAGTAPAAIVTRRLEPIYVLGCVVADEIYGRSIPIVVVDGDTFAGLQQARRLSIDRLGELTLLD